MMSECIAANIQDMMKAIGEEGLQRLLSDFSSPLNKEVMRNWTKKRINIMYQLF